MRLARHLTTLRPLVPYRGLSSSVGDGIVAAGCESFSCDAAPIQTEALAGESTADVTQLQAQVAKLTQELAVARRELSRVAEAMPLDFSVMQYNVLASYLGHNTQPWFMYGIGDLDARPTDPDKAGLSRREEIINKFYERTEPTPENPRGDLKNKVCACACACVHACC